VLEAIHEDLDAPLLANVTHYAAHGHTFLALLWTGPGEERMALFILAAVTKSHSSMT
jgi:hypothetical protein